MPIPANPTFPVEPANTPIAQVVCKILVEPDEGDAEPIGTAISIAGNLVLTARHNIDFIVRKYGRPNAEGVAPYAIRLYSILPGPEYGVWQVNHLWVSGHSDLALLRLSLHGYSGDVQPGPGPGANMRVLLPSVGSRIAGFGYHSTKAAYSRNLDGSLHLDLTSVPQTTTGRIVEVYPHGRDRGMYHFPCFQVNARFDPGMSGGPVFDDNGKLIGIISGNLPPADGGNEHVSYVAAIWPMLEMTIQNVLPGAEKEETFMLELANEGTLHVADLADYLVARPASSHSLT